MSKINLEDDNVFYIETTQEAVRSYFDGAEINEVLPDFDSVSDSAQGHVGISGKPSFIVIEIKP